MVEVTTTVPEILLGLCVAVVIGITIGWIIGWHLGKRYEAGFYFSRDRMVD